METNLTSILSGFGVSDPSSIKQIYRSAWDIDDEYVLKTNKDKNQLEKKHFYKPSAAFGRNSGHRIY